MDIVAEAGVLVPGLLAGTIWALAVEQTIAIVAVELEPGKAVAVVVLKTTDNLSELQQSQNIMKKKILRCCCC